jgi:O-antigen ligase
MIIKKNKLFINLSSILFILIPVSLITGPFIPDLFLVTIVLFFLSIICFQKQFQFLDKIYVKIYLVLCLYLILISIFSGNLISLKSSLFYFRFGVFALAISYLINNDPKILNKLFIFLVIIYIFLFIDALYQYFFLKNILGFVYNNESNFRITSFFGKDEVLGSYVARFYPFLLFLLYGYTNYSSSKKFFYLTTIITIISFTVILLSGERTSLALFILSFFFIFLSSVKFRKIFILPLIIIILVFIFTIISSEKIKYRIVTSTIDQMGLNSGSERMILFSKTYEGHYLISYNMFKKKPFFGHGAKMFRFFCAKKENFVPNNACTTHPHNFYAQMLAEAGIVGFLILLSTFLYIFYLFVKNLVFQIYKKKQLLSDKAICLLSFYFMTLFPLLPSGNFFNNWLSIIMYYPLGCLIYLIIAKKIYA